MGFGKAGSWENSRALAGGRAKKCKRKSDVRRGGIKGEENVSSMRLYLKS